MNLMKFSSASFPKVHFILCIVVNKIKLSNKLYQIYDITCGDMIFIQNEKSLILLKLMCDFVLHLNLNQN